MKKKVISITALASVIFSSIQWWPERYRWHYSLWQGELVYTFLIAGWVAAVWLGNVKKVYKYAFSISMGVFIAAVWAFVLLR